MGFFYLHVILAPHSVSLDSDSGFDVDFKASSILAAVQTVLITANVPQTMILLISIGLP